MEEFRIRARKYLIELLQVQLSDRQADLQIDLELDDLAEAEISRAYIAELSRAISLIESQLE